MAERNGTKATGREIIGGRKPNNVVRRNRVHLRLTNEHSPSLLDEIPAEISTEVPEVLAPSFAQSHESQTSSFGEVNPPASSQGSSSLSGSKVPSAVVTSPPKPVLRRSERQRRLPKQFKDFNFF